MSISQQDFDPIRYQPPTPPRPPREKLSGWKPSLTCLIACGSLVLLLAIGVPLALHSLLNREEVQAVIKHMPRNEQFVGETFSWRMLYEYPARKSANITGVIGDFDADEEKEILILDVPPFTSEMIELNGGSRTVPFQREVRSRRYLTWDWDGDGIDELLSESTGDSPGVDIFNLAGELVHTIENRTMEGFSIVGDYDGDYRPDLLLRVDGDYTPVVYRQQGLEARKGESLFPGYPCCLADLNGDGKKAVISASNLGYQVITPDGYERPGWDLIYPAWTADLSGRGSDWLVDLGEGILNPATGVKTQFQWPPEIKASFGDIYIWRLDRFDVAAFTPPGSTEPRLAVASIVHGPHFMLFNRDGQLVYHQEFFGIIYRMGVVELNGQQTLLLITNQGILTYP